MKNLSLSLSLSLSFSESSIAFDPPKQADFSHAWCFHGDEIPRGVTRVDSVERKAGMERSIVVPQRARQLVPGAVSRRFACVDGTTVLKLVAEIFPRFEVEKRRRTARHHGERGFRRQQILENGTIKVSRFDSCTVLTSWSTMSWELNYLFSCFVPEASFRWKNRLEQTTVEICATIGSSIFFREI